MLSILGAGDIVDGNLKLILGLIWTLILHYQISMGFGLDDEPKGGPSPKQALLDWINVRMLFICCFLLVKLLWLDGLLAVAFN